jgi:riboflavin synthase
MRRLVRKGNGAVLEVDMGPMADEVTIGESVAINGCCLTVSTKTMGTVSFDVSPETLARSTFLSMSSHALLNIERAMRADGRLDGHFVQGHVDGVGKIVGIDRQGEFATFWFSVPKDLLEEIVVKGSVAVDGISLTVAAVEGQKFSVAVIPATLARTSLKNARVGDTVNIETDIICKIIRRQVAGITSGRGLSAGRLAEYGFAENADRQ